MFLMFFSSILLYFLWNWLAPVYLSFLPSVYLDIPFWHVWGIMATVSLLSHCVFAGVKKPNVEVDK
jgi:hypothetical protein